MILNNTNGIVEKPLTYNVVYCSSSYFAYILKSEVKPKILNEREVKMENNEAKRIILNAVFEFINSDMNVSRNWRSGFSGAPCGLSTFYGNCKLLHKIVGDDWKKDFAIWQNPNLVVSAVEAVAQYYELKQMRWHWELPTLRAAIWAKKFNIHNPETIKSVWGLSNPRIEAIVSAL